MTFDDLNVPEGWNVFTVEKLIEDGIIAKPLDGNHGGIHPKSKDYVDDGIPFVMASDMENGEIDFIGCKKITLQQAKTLRKGFAKAGDVLLSHKATIGRTAILQKNSFEHVLLTPQVTYYRVIDFQKLNPVYLKTYFDSPKFQALFKLWSGDGSTRAYLGITAQQKLPIVLPPIDIQNNISSVIASFNEKVNTNINMNATLEKIAQRIFNSWFVDFDPVKANAEGVPFDGLSPEIQSLFPNEFEESELGMIPKGWSASNIGKEFDVVMGQSPPGSSYNETGEGTLFFQGRRDFGFRYPSERVFTDAPKRLAKAGDTLLSVRAPVGDVNKALKDCCVGRGVGALRHKSGCESFTYYVSKRLRSIFDNFDGEGTVFGSINQTELKALKIIAPSNEVMKRFNDISTPLDERIKVNTEQINSLTKIRDKLLPRLISGKISIQKAEELLEEAS
jgi:type I restriction enzyme S subunit